MASKRNSISSWNAETVGRHELLNSTQKSFIIDKLRKKYIRRSSVTPVSGDKLSSRRTSNHYQSDNNSAKNPLSFRDVVLKVAKHKAYRANLDITSQRRLSNIGHQDRLEKFRQAASRWKMKTKKATPEIPESPEIDLNLPEKPRFCATLSTEAQYAIFKGYEDALVNQLSSSLEKSHEDISIKRVPSATIHEKAKPITIMENEKPNIILVSPIHTSDEHSRENSYGKQRELRFISARFKQAMDILDDLKQHSSSIEPEETEKALEASFTVKKNIQQFHAWSQQWAKHFQFGRS